MATIKDIARIAEVGIGTVSRVLNGGDKVKPETSEKILKIAEELGYRPNRIAQSLVRKLDETITVGLIIPEQIREIHWEIIKGIYHYISEKGIHLSAYKAFMLQPQKIRNLIASNVHGLLCLDLIIDEQAIKILRGARLPFVHLGKKVDDQSCISINHSKGGNLAARHLASRNVKKAAFVGLIENVDIQEPMFEGFAEECNRRNIEVVARTEVPAGDQEGYKVTRILWQRGDVDGIFFASDELAYGAFRFFREVNQGLPIIGYGDMPASKILSLSTLRYPSHNLGFLGTEKLVEIIKAGTFNEILSIELLPDLVTRKS